MSKDDDLPSAEKAIALFKKYRPTHPDMEAQRYKLMKQGEKDFGHSKGKHLLSIAKSLQDTHEELNEYAGGTTRRDHLDPQNSLEQTHQNIGHIVGKITNAHINDNHGAIVNHATHLARVLSVHNNAVLKNPNNQQARDHVQTVKGLLHGVNKNRDLPNDLRDRAKQIKSHLMRHVPDSRPYKLKFADPSDTDFTSYPKKKDLPHRRLYRGVKRGIGRLFEEHEEPTLSEQYLEWLELNELTSPDTKRCFTGPDGEKICYKGPNRMEKMWDKHKQDEKERESKKK